MTPGITTWDEIGRLHGSVLAIINSPPEDRQTVATLFDQLQASAAGCALHVIAGREWRAWLKARHVPDDRVLVSEDAAGTSLELNHFLDSPNVTMWTAARRFEQVIGSAPHAVYNDEVKDIFERRLTLLVGAGRYLAHTLPNPYVFVLDLPALLVRLARRHKMEEYAATCRALVGELHRLWIDLGAPDVPADPVRPPDAPALETTAAFDVVRRHLRPDLLAFDEAAPIALSQPDLSHAFADVVLHLQQTLREHDEQLADRSDAVTAREAIIAEIQAERVAAVNLRDTIIENLRREQETMVQRWRRKLRGQ